MINASQIKEHMTVKGSDGKHVGTVLGVEDGRLRLVSGGMDHDIDIDVVDGVEGFGPLTTVPVCLRRASGTCGGDWR